MAKKKDDKAADSSEKKKSGKGGMIFGLLAAICSTLSLTSILILFAGIYSLGFVDLTATLEKLAAPSLLVLILATVLGAFARSKATTSASAEALAKFEDVKGDLEQKISAAELKIESYLGENYNSLKTDNDTMKERFEKIEAAERKKNEEEHARILEELQDLRTKNVELQEQLNKNAQQINEHTLAAEQLSAA